MSAHTYKALVSRHLTVSCTFANRSLIKAQVRSAFEKTFGKSAGQVTDLLGLKV